MDKSLIKIKSLLLDQEGQAIIEYVLMLSLAITFIGLLATGFKQPLQSLWHLFAQEITAPCPACPSPIQ
jgi:hypothetical protein